jgi:hypothetical protein
MRRIVAFGLLGVLAVSAPGCGGPDALLHEALANLNAYAESVEKKDPLDRQLATLERFRATEEKLNKLPPDKKEQLLKRYEAELKRARDRLDAALKSQVLEGGTSPPNPLDNFLK